MPPTTEYIAVQPQEGSSLLFILMNLMLVAFATSMAQMDINFIWWGPFLIFFFIALSYSYLMRPVEIRFSGGSRQIDVVYRYSCLTKKSQIFAFSDAESIQSRFRVTGDNDPEVLLEMTIKKQNSLLLMSATPDWSPTAPALGYSGCLEPKKIEVLRQQIASLTGIEDRGFLR